MFPEDLTDQLNMIVKSPEKNVPCQMFHIVLPNHALTPKLPPLKCLRVSEWVYEDTGVLKGTKGVLTCT